MVGRARDSVVLGKNVMEATVFVPAAVMRTTLLPSSDIDRPWRAVGAGVQR